MSFHNMGLLDFKKKFLDTKSDSFCGAKWHNATIWLHSGTNASCHHPPAHRINPEELADNPTALHNTKFKKQVRKQMQEGIKPSECDYCWRIEGMDRNAISDRVFKSIIYTGDELDKVYKLNYQEDVNPITLEVSFDRTCNFACSYCNPSFSTAWGKDIETKGPYQNLVSDGAKTFQQDGKWSQPFKEDENPYIKAFWQWWPDLVKTLREFRITGGEPLMSQQVWKLFDYFKEHGSGDLLFSINSNLGARKELIDKLIERSHYVEKFDLYTSCEAVGAQAEYIRDGLDYEYWKSNMVRLFTEANVRTVNIMMTINSLSLFSMTELLDQLIEWKREYGKECAYWSVNLLRFPSFMSPLALPDEIKEERRFALKEWLKKNSHHEFVDEGELASVQRLIDYLEVVDAPHKRTSSMDTRFRDFKSFYMQYDKRRNKNFRETFPKNLVDWYDSLPITKVNEVGLQQAHAADWVLDPEDKNPS